MLDMKEKYSLGRDDTVICLISGGGSALMPLPADGISLEDKQYITNRLLACGADIYEINTVRKHISRSKGGKLAHHYAPATVISLIISDVVGNDLAVIASGPTHPDTSTFADAREILQEYGLLASVPGSVVDCIQQGCQGLIPETVKALENVHNYIIGDNRQALNAMYQEAVIKGFSPHIITDALIGDTTAVAQTTASKILAGEYGEFNALIIGGETTPTLPASAGRGGRNQHYAAVAMVAIQDCNRRWAMASVGTDGSDFLPDAAGALVDSDTLGRLNDKSVNISDYIDRYDSNALLSLANNALILTGDTGTNVGDIILYLFEDSL